MAVCDANLVCTGLCGGGGKEKRCGDERGRVRPDGDVRCMVLGDKWKCERKRDEGKGSERKVKEGEEQGKDHRYVCEAEEMPG